MGAAALVGHLVRRARYALLAEHRHRLFPDELFVDLFVDSGPSVGPG
jgi:hypothetical protein